MTKLFTKNNILIIILITIFTVFLFEFKNLIRFSTQNLTMVNDSQELIEQYQNAIVETSYAYYYRGRAIQYDNMRISYESGQNAKPINYLKIVNNKINSKALYSPEDATIQDFKHFVCSHFALAVYAETFYNSSTGEKYLFRDNNGNISYVTNDLSDMADPTNEESYNEKIAIYQMKIDSNNKNEAVSEITSRIKPGDLFIYISSSGSGHVMIYVGGPNKEIIHSNAVAPSIYRSAGKVVNSYAGYNSIYHLESKANIIETNSGTLEDENDKTGTVVISKIEDYINGHLGDSTLFSILRPINEIKDDSNYKLSENSKNRLSMPGLVLTKTSSTEKYESVNIGGKITYTIEIENKSDTDYKNIIIEEKIPEYTEFYSMSQYGTLNNNKILWTIDLDKKSKTTEFFTVEVSKKIENIGKVINSNHGRVNGIPLKEIKTNIKKSLTTEEQTNLVNNVNKEQNEYLSSSDFIKEMYKKIGYDVDIPSATTVFERMFEHGIYQYNPNDGFNKRTLDLVDKETFTLKKKENLDSNYKEMFVDELFGGVYTAYENESPNNYERNMVYTSKSLMTGDILYIYDDDYINDDISMESGYVVGEKNAYLYLGNGEFATINNKKVYIYKKNESFKYCFYISNDRSKNQCLDLENNNLRNVSIGERLLISLLGQNSFIVLRPSYATNYKLTGINIEKIPNKTNYYIGEKKVNLEGGKLELNYGTAFNETIDLNNADVNIVKFDSSNLGKAIIEIEYKGFRTSFEVNIVKKEIKSIDIISKPNKTKYIQNYEKLDLTGGILKITYSDNSEKEISFSDSSLNITGFDNSKIGVNTIKIEYNNHIVSFELEIIPKFAVKLDIIKPPTKVKYIQNYEKLDLTGGLLKITYIDNSVSEMSLNNKNLKISGFNNNKIGVNTIKVDYAGLSSTFEIEIISKKVDKIEIKALPVKMKYIQNYEILDLTGGILKVLYNDNSTSELELLNEKIKISGFDNSIIGRNIITIEYEGKNTTFEIEIISKTITEISVLKRPTKIRYKKNYDDLDLTGGIIKILYNDESSSQLSMTNPDIIVTGFDNSTVGFNEIEIKYNNHVTSFNVEIFETETTQKKPTQKKDNINRNYLLILLAIVSFIGICFGGIYFNKYYLKRQK